jgi:hypothetical protein
MIEAVVIGKATQAHWVNEPHVAIVGGARGADNIAEEMASHESGAYGSEILVFPADWDKWGKRAGPIRNKQMLDEGEPDLVIAFVDKPLRESRGTRDMVCRAVDAGLPVYVVEKVA